MLSTKEKDARKDVEDAMSAIELATKKCGDAGFNFMCVQEQLLEAYCCAAQALAAIDAPTSGE